MSVVLKVLSIILGIMLICAAITMMTNTMWVPKYGGMVASSLIILIAGIGALVYGVFNTVLWFQIRRTGSVDGWDLAGSILAIALGIFLLVTRITGADVLMKILRWVIAIAALIFAIKNIRRSILLSRADNASGQGGSASWILMLVLGILMLIISICMMFNAEFAFMTMGIWMAIELLTLGFSMITFSFAA